MTGRKSKPILDSIDIALLEMLIESEEGAYIMELVKATQLNHQNLLTHIKKLSGFGLITITKQSIKKLLEITDRGCLIYTYFKDFDKRF